MSFLSFVDDELEIMFEVVNSLQICFHHIYAPMGKFDFGEVFDLQMRDQDIIIIVDKNLVSPICEIAKTGTLKDELRRRKVAMFVTWSKFLGARLTCGLGILETDTSEICTVTGEEERLQFLHAVEKIPASLWKELAFGYRDIIPDTFLCREIPEENKEYRFNDNLLLVSNEAAVIKIVQLLRTPNMTGIERFISFMEWYTYNLDIAESIMVYAAFVFANIQNVAPPKNVKSEDYQKVVKGIKNQAWDFTYIVAWSTQYRNEVDNRCTMFATDDITQKIIVVNIIPPGRCADALHTVFTTNAQYKKLMQLSETRLGNARKRPYENLKTSEKVIIVKELVEKEYESLKQMFK